jgi:hypothetical protein
MTTPVTAQGPGLQGTSAQQGYPPGFPIPLGIEQYFGQPQQSGSPQLYGGFPQQYGSPQYGFPQQSQFGGQQGPVQQIVQSLVSQLLPVAHQVILPQVLATAMQQIPLQLQQLGAQQVAWQLGQQMGWQQPQFAQQGRAYPGGF